MTISPSTGLVSGTPVTPFVHTGITVSAQRGSGLIVSKTFTCTVDNSKFIFVSTTGNDLGAGTLADPYLTIAKGISQLNGSTGKTLYVRAGTYLEGYQLDGGGGNPIPFNGKDRTPTDYNNVRGYPGEALPYWNFTGVSSYSGFNFNAEYNIIEKMEIGNGNRPGFPKLIAMSSVWGIVRDCVMHDSNGTAGNNLCAIEVKPESEVDANTEILVDRNVFYNCFQTSAPSPSHSSNNNATGLMLFSDSPVVGFGSVGKNTFWIYALNNKSYLNSWGIKTKHVGQDRMILQNNECINNYIGSAQCGSPNMAFRHNVLYKGGLVDLVPNADNGPAGPSWYERNTIVHPSGSYNYMLNFQGTVQNGGGYFINNICAAGALSTELFRLWEYEPDWSIHDINIDYNLYQSGHGSPFRVGGGGATQVSFTNWKLKTIHGTKHPDTHGAFANPLFANVATGDLNITSASPAATMASDGTYVGALEPGKVYGLFGQNNTTLNNFNINGSVSLDPEPEPPSSSIGYFSFRKRRGFGGF